MAPATPGDHVDIEYVLRDNPALARIRLDWGDPLRRRVRPFHPGWLRRAPGGRRRPVLGPARQPPRGQPRVDVDRRAVGATGPRVHVERVAAGRAAHAAATRAVSGVAAEGDLDPGAAAGRAAPLGDPALDDDLPPHSSLLETGGRSARAPGGPGRSHLGPAAVGPRRVTPRLFRGAVRQPRSARGLPKVGAGVSDDLAPRFPALAGRWQADGVRAGGDGWRGAARAREGVRAETALDGWRADGFPAPCGERLDGRRIGKRPTGARAVTESTWRAPVAGRDVGTRSPRGVTLRCARRPRDPPSGGRRRRCGVWE